MLKQAPVMWDVAEELFDETAFLWSQWKRLQLAPNLFPAQVATGPEERLFRHFEALALYPPEKLGEFLDRADPRDRMDKLFTAMLVILENPEHRKALYDLIKPIRRDRAMPPTYGRALAMCHGPRVEAIPGRLLQTSDHRFQAAALTTLGKRGIAVGQALVPFLLSEWDEHRIPALKAARFGGPEVRSAIEGNLRSPNASIRDAAIESGLVHGMKTAYQAARQVVENKGSGLVFPLTVLAISGALEDLGLIATALEDPAHQSDALWALGFSGWPGAVDLCLPFLDHEQLGRRAGETLSVITGLELKGVFAVERSDVTDPEGPEFDDDTSLGPEAKLPVPNAVAVESWWMKERGRFTPSQRYFGGKPITAELLLAALVEGPMSRREVHAYELSVRTKGEYQLPTAIWVRDQLQRLSEKKMVVPSGFNAPFGRLLRI